MIQKIATPARIDAPGGKVIEEYVGRVRSSTNTMSVAHMVAPAGWDEPYQRPVFDEVTVVLRGAIRVEHRAGHIDVAAGEVVLVSAGERIRYHNPFAEEAEYWAICVPAFSPELARRGDG